MNLLSLTTLRELLRLSLPMVVSQGTFAVMIFTDRWFMAQIDATHIAASMGGGVAAMFCMSLFMGVISYGNALVAQYYGSGQMDKCPRGVTQALVIVLCSAPMLFLLGFSGSGAFELLGHDPAQVPLEQAYFQVLMYGAAMHLGKAAFASYFAGIGRTQVIMVTDVLSIMVNVPLSWALIFGHGPWPALGIVGAGLGTVIAMAFSIAIYLCFYLTKSHRLQFAVGQSLHFDRGIMRRYLRLGMPSGIEAFMNSATFNLFLLMFQAYGVVEGASMAIVFNWDMLSFIPMTGLNIGVMTLIGRFVGAGDMARANQVISSGFIVALGYSGLLAILFLLFRTNLIDVFATNDANFDEIRTLASAMMVGLVTYMMADAVILISGGALRGAGDTRWIMITSTSLHWLMLVAQYFVISVWKLPPLVSWWVFVAMLLSIAGCFSWRLLGGRWRQPERLARVMQE